MNTTKKSQKSSLAKRNLQKFLANRFAIVGAVGAFLIIMACVCAPLITPNSPTFIDPTIRNLPPSAEHWLGTDSVGRDIFARILYGGRISIWIGVSCAIGSTLLGAVLGCVAGFFGGKIGSILVTFQEFVSMFPTNLLIMLIAAFISRSVTTMIIIFIMTSWGSPMRIIRGKILALKEEPFVESCRANGISGWSIMFHHMLPNTLGPIIVNMSLNVAGFILTEAGLSFIGLGVPETVPTWGNIINAAKRLDIIQTKPMLWLAPGVAICLFVLCVNFLGDGLRDALDPSSK